MSKIIVAYLEQNGLLPEAQSAYRRGHSTETAILKQWRSDRGADGAVAPSGNC